MVSDLVVHKPGSTATEDGWRLEISDLESRGIVLYYSKNVLHHLIFTKFLSSVLNKYTNHFFLNIILPWRVGQIVWCNNKFV